MDNYFNETDPAQCEDCKCGPEEGLFYDEDGRLLCPDCLFERQCEELANDHQQNS